jgi:hypothetical protein
VQLPLWKVPHARNISSSAASSQQQQRGATPTEEAQNLSKAFLTSVLDAEDLWLKGVAGQLKMWAATKKVPLEVRPLTYLNIKCCYSSFLCARCSSMLVSCCSQEQ